jgi:ABC-type polysaccharide/polyol phosphate transport system ATPase subunit
MDQIQQLCTRAVWLERGALRMDGDVDRVLEAYRAHDSHDLSRGAP